MSEQPAEKNAVDRAVAEDRVESCQWFLTLLKLHGYKGQPVWNETLDFQRQMRAHRRNVLRRKRNTSPGGSDA